MPSYQHKLEQIADPESVPNRTRLVSSQTASTFQYQSIGLKVFPNGEMASTTTHPQQSSPRAPDSPRPSQSPPPQGLQGDLELELFGLANALYNLGTTVVLDSTKGRDNSEGKPVGIRVNDVVAHLAAVDDISQHISAMVPMQILSDVDHVRDPMLLSKERLERAATENQFMNGKIAAMSSYRKLLDESVAHNFPDLVSHLKAEGREHVDQLVG